MTTYYLTGEGRICSNYFSGYFS